MAAQEVVGQDLSISGEAFQALDYEQKVEHRMRVTLGLRKSVGGFAVRASEDELYAFKHKVHLGPDGEPYAVHPYDTLYESVVRDLAGRGIHRPVEPDIELSAAA